MSASIDNSCVNGNFCRFSLLLHPTFVIYSLLYFSLFFMKHIFVAVLVVFGIVFVPQVSATTAKTVSGEATFTRVAPSPTLKKAYLLRKIKETKTDIATLQNSIVSLEKKIVNLKQTGKPYVASEKKLKTLRANKALLEMSLLLLEKKLKELDRK